MNLNIESSTSCICNNKQTEGALNSAMLHAVKSNCIFCVKKLGNKVDPNHNFASHNELPRTYLFIACENGNKEIVEYLLQKKAQPLVTTDQHQYGAIHYVKNIDLIELLLKKGADINQEIRHFGTNHCGTNREKCANTRCDCGKTPLFFYLLQSNLNELKMLLEKGANILHTLDSGNNILHYFAGRVTSELEAFKPYDQHSNLHKDIQSLFLCLKESCFHYNQHSYSKQLLGSLCKVNKCYRSTIIIFLLIKNRIPYIKKIPFFVLSQKIFSQMITVWEVLLTAHNKDNKTAIQLLEENKWLYEKIKDLL